MKRLGGLTVALCLGLASPPLLPAQVPDHTGPVICPVPLGELVRQSASVVVLRVEAVVSEEELVILKPVATLAGEEVAGPIRHHADSEVLDWARPGKEAVFFFEGGHAVTCVGNHWYYCWKGGESTDPPVWSCADWVDGFAHSYVGPVDRLQEHVRAIAAGREVVVTARAFEETVSFPLLPETMAPDWLHGRKGRVWRIKAGPQVTRPVLSADSPAFVGWGVGGAEVVPALVASLGSKDAPARAEAVADLGGLGLVARPALPALRQALRDADPFVRVHAVEALASVDPGSRPELSVIQAALTAGSPAVRRTAVGALAALGPRAKPAVLDLIRALRRDDDPDVRRGAALALGRLASAPTAAARPDDDLLAALAAALEHDPDEQVRSAIVRILPAWGARACVAVPGLNAVLRSGKQHQAIHDLTLDLLTRLDPPAVEVLGSALQDVDSIDRAEIAAYLDKLGPRARAATPALREALRDAENDELRWHAARALVRMDPWIAFELPRSLFRELARPPQDNHDVRASHLREALGETVDPVRRALPAALRRADASGERVQAWTRTSAALTELLDRSMSAEQARRIGVWESRGLVGPMTGPATVWQEQVSGVVAAVTELVGRLDNENQPAPVLTAAVRDRNRYVRVAAVAALSRVDPRHPAVVPTMLSLLEEHPALFWHLADALGRLGPDARAAVPWLQRALLTEDRATYQAASEVLRRIDPQAVAGVWSASALRPPAGVPAPSEAEGNALWSDLARDAVAGYRASWALATDDGLALTFLRERLRPVPLAGPVRLVHLIADLDSEDFTTREQATAELATLREGAESAMRRALAAGSSPEVRRRVEGLLERLGPSSGERLRESRAVRILEDIGTPEARGMLEACAGGTPEARLTQEAKAALQRLTW